MYYVYIVTNKPNGTIYIGVTNNFERRIYEHSTGIGSAFTRKYNLHRLVFLEEFQNINDAIAREKQIKTWNRARKIRFIEECNPTWADISYK